MGLDMYLVEKPKGKPISHHVQIGYWRKANAIHKWFVDNVMNGCDDNNSYHKVSKEQFEELLRLVNLVLESKELAQEVLPTQSGFFFGETDYTESYFQNLIDTKFIIEKVLNNWNENKDYLYSPSW